MLSFIDNKLSGWMGSGVRLQVGISSMCLLSFVLFGYDQGVFGGILQNENWKHQFNDPNDVMTGIIVSSYTLGCIGGCVCKSKISKLQNTGYKSLT